jgi:hypothetical protein
MLTNGIFSRPKKLIISRAIWEIQGRKESPKAVNWRVIRILKGV